MIDLLIAQENAKEKLKSRMDMEDLLDQAEEERKEQERQNMKSMGEFFNIVAENSSRFAKLFAEEQVDGERGLEILRRSGTVRPFPLATQKDPGFVSQQVDMLEKAISTEQK